MPDRVVVFNADDLGISEGTNAGIRAACEAGLVRETSLCVTGVAVEAGAEVAHALGDRLAVGLHLSLTLGKALSGPIGGLTDEGGCFPPLGRVLKSCLLRRPSRADLVREVRAQVERVRSLGFPLSHLNGHHHVHVFPVVREAVLTVVKETEIPYVRVPREQFTLAPRILAIAAMSRGFVRAAARQGVRLNALPFLGLQLFDRADYRQRFLAAAEGLAAPATEWMVHPRREDADFARLDHHAAGAFANYPKELATLTDGDVVSAVRDLGIRPAAYSEL